jgi:tRNA uridine 5-carboxymethylaminomethyl modification enzyme
MNSKYDIIVVGAGHAGCEAAAAAANLGSKVLLITMNMETIAKMSCNPAMGGVAKGQIVREIDALGGYSGIVTDNTMVQFRMLNRSKGPAMWSPRAQSDRWRFAEEWRLHLESIPNIDFRQDMVDGLVVEREAVKGVTTSMGLTYYANSVILTNGTFLNGLIHIGRKNFGGGRMGERQATGITAQLEQLGFVSGRMKTGTPPRVDGRSLDYSKMDEQKGDENPDKFSYLDSTKPLENQRSCHITYTNQVVHDILREGFDDSPLFNGTIGGMGPRYCPSVEDKINRFAGKDRHQIFVEPEGWNTVEIYVNGFSTSLPEEIQQRAMHQIPGFENAKMFTPGYAIEYDFFQPTQLKHTLETKIIKNLYFAGQINGTTGYEEAGCQGLMAGINAHNAINEKDPFILSRDEAYIGVLIDDLINKGTEEPYRMFTSRAEYRILLRQDNADIRLTEKGYDIGLASSERMQRVEEKIKNTNSIMQFLEKKSVTPVEVNPILTDANTPGIKQNYKATKLLSRPQMSIDTLLNLDALSSLKKYPKEDLLESEILIKYQGYIDKEYEQVEKMKRLENIKISDNFDYMKINSLSHEAKEKLSSVRPQTIGHASRISGVSPADISVLLVHFGR